MKVKKVSKKKNSRLPTGPSAKEGGTGSWKKKTRKPLKGGVKRWGLREERINNQSRRRIQGATRHAPKRKEKKRINCPST